MQKSYSKTGLRDNCPPQKLSKNILNCAMRRKGITMKTIKNTKIIGIDHGYGNMKTANHCFKTGISAYDSEPLFTADMLTYNGKHYLIGEGHKEFAPDKVKDEDYYVLTLAAIAKELKTENLTEAHIVIAAGLPLTWTSGQKADFKAYLMKNTEVKFTYKFVGYLELPSLARQCNYREETRKGVAVEYVPNALPA